VAEGRNMEGGNILMYAHRLITCERNQRIMTEYFQSVCVSNVFIYLFVLHFMTLSVAQIDRLCGLEVRVPGDSEVPDSIPGATRFSEK
jgi:hypothetical protein